VFLVNSRNPLVTATPFRSGRRAFTYWGHTFSRSYGANLPSSLASVLPRALGCSPRPPESVCGTDTKEAHYAAFLGSMESPGYEAEASPHHVSVLSPRLSRLGPKGSTYLLEPGIPTTRTGLSFSVPA
jgi:hypothetical protein